jgi:hypothetical protein
VGQWLLDIEREWESSGKAARIVCLSNLNGNSDEQATAMNIDRLLLKAPDEIDGVDLIAYYGHGTRCRLATKGDAPNDSLVSFKVPKARTTRCTVCARLPVSESLIDLDDIPKICGRAVYAVACWSGEVLGQRATLPEGNSGTTAFFGFSDAIPVMADLPTEHSQLRDIMNGGLRLLREVHPTTEPDVTYGAVWKHVAMELEELVDSRKGQWFQPLLEMWRLFWWASWTGGVRQGLECN